jgi:hypothetical protein
LEPDPEPFGRCGPGKSCPRRALLTVGSAIGNGLPPLSAVAVAPSLAEARDPKELSHAD